MIIGSVKGFVAKNNATFRLKDVKELTYAAFEKNTKDVWTKAEEHVIKIEKEYCKENINYWGLFFSFSFSSYNTFFGISSRKGNDVLCKIVLENSFFLTKIWTHRIFCFNIVISFPFLLLIPKKVLYEENEKEKKRPQ
jgi:hypothetical protein